MTDKEFLKGQRKTHALLTAIWFLVIGIPLIVCGVIKQDSAFYFGGIGLGLLPPLISMFLNWNDTSRYS